jgi:long-chain acyl-CoA synthetase
VFEGYYRMEEKTEECFTEDGFFRTGDLARIEDGQVFIEGRISTRIALQGGENVDPTELEDIYGEVEGVEEIGVLEDEGKLAALVVPEGDLLREGGADEAASRLKKKLKARGEELASYRRLARVELSTRPLERTRLGKLRRHALEEAYAKARAGEDGKAKAEQPAEIESLSSEDRALLEDGTAHDLWDLLCERYPDRPVEPDAHLEIDLGIDSMEWVELSVSIESKIGVAVDEDLIARVDRVRDLLEAVAESGEAGEREDIKEPLENPKEALSREDLHRTESRGPIRLLIGTFLFLLLRLCLRCFLRIEAKGLDRLPEAPYLLTPNHASYLDAPSLGLALGYQRARRFFWAGDTNIMLGNPVMRAISKLAQVVPIDARRRPRSSLAFVALLLDRKRPLVWFPEGGISGDGELQAFQPGLGVLLQQHDVPVVPVRIEGTYESLPRGRLWPRRSHVRVHFGQPCPAEELRGGDGESREPKEIAEALRRKVAALREGT